MKREYDESVAQIPKIEDRWLEYFRDRGYPEAHEIAKGMEGAVYSLLPGTMVAKIWQHRDANALRMLQRFCSQVACAVGDRIATPEIMDVQIVDGIGVTIERYLKGVPLKEHLDPDARVADPRAVDAVLSVLEILRSVADSDEFRKLPVLGEQESLWLGASHWSEALAGLLARRVRPFRDQLAADVPDFDRVLESADAFLHSRVNSEMTLIHGDLCAENIMVDSDLRPVAVIDFGFLSSVGDPVFEASIASAIFNMYGSSARDVDAQLTDAVINRMNFDHNVLLGYRAIYALVTSNIYSADGSDGHYRWCVAMLNRPDVRAALFN